MGPTLLCGSLINGKRPININNEDREELNMSSMSMICIHLANNINFSILDRESIENLWETNNIFNNNFVALYNVMSKTNVIYSSENEPTIFLI